MLKNTPMGNRTAAAQAQNDARSNVRGDDGLKTILKAASVLECFSTQHSRLSVADISRMTGISRGSLHRIVNTLKGIGYIDQERERDQYRLGMKLFQLGTTVLENMDLQRESRHLVERLTKVCEQTVFLCVFDGLHSTIINRGDLNKSEARTSVTIEASPAYCTASGKVALAFQDDDAVERLIAHGLKRVTVNTITDPEAFRAEMATIRERGYATNNEEQAPGVRCVAAPIRNGAGRVFAALSISGSTTSFDAAKVRPFSELVMSYAQDISSSLGFDRY